MDKLAMETPDGASMNIDKLAQLFPQVITEKKGKDGKTVRSVNFDALRDSLTKVEDVELSEGREEYYEFSWPGKRKAKFEAAKPIRKTLRPDMESSKDWDTTENLYIEGDNLEALKLLKEAYLGKVKMIYIDPPYNTGNDFVYKDDFKTSSADLFESAGVIDEYGERMVSNSRTNGRFHSVWCTMIYSRLLLARDFLTDDGFIFISIDDNEISSLLLICDEVFGEDNFVGNICRATGTTTAQGTDSLGKSFDYMLVYSKNPNFVVSGIPLSEKDISRYKYSDEKGKFSILQLRRTGGEDRREDRPSMYFPIQCPDGTIVYPTGPTGYESRWRVGLETYNKMLRNNEIYFKKTNDTWQVYYKFYLEGRTKRPSNLWDDIEGNKKAQIDLKTLIPNNVFETPKPLELITRAIQIAGCKENDIVMDFFAGSSSTAHAILKQNSIDSTILKFILVQLPDPCDSESQAFKSGYNNICEIGKERIRRAGSLICDTGAKVDTGFRVFKIDSSNMKDIYYKPSEFSSNLFESTLDNLKSDRTELDLLYGCLVDWGVELSLPYREEAIDNHKVHIVDNNALVACFEDSLESTFFKKLASMQPLRLLLTDKCFSNSADKCNALEIIKKESPNTDVKVL